jgi:hypothetical protein
MSEQLDFKPRSMEALQEQLRKAFRAPSVDLDQVKKLLEGYNSNKADWQKYAFKDIHRFALLYPISCPLPGIIPVGEFYFIGS